MSDDPELEVRRLQFETTYDAMKTFFEWRHHIFTRFFVGIGGVAIAWQWLDDKGLGIQSAVLMLAALFSRMMALSDRVNSDHLRHLYDLGAQIERGLPGALQRGVFATIDRRPTVSVRWWAPGLWLFWVPRSSDEPGAGRSLRYSSILSWLYNGTAISLVVLLAVNLIA